MVRCKCGREFDSQDMADMCERIDALEDSKRQFILFKRLMKKFRKEEARNNIPSFFNNIRRYG